MKKSTLSIMLAACLGLTSHANASSVATVNNGNDSGAGSLRAALESGATTIRFAQGLSAIQISEPLVYNGNSKLTLLGSGQVIDATAMTDNGDILSLSSGADLTMRNLNLIGSAVEVNSDADTTVGGKGIFVNVPETSQGLIRVNLNGVTVSNVGNHGIHVSDCTLRDECGGGSGGVGQGSTASVYLKLNDVEVNNVGFGKQDADGVRVDERGDGNIYFSANNSRFLNVGADGIELDEGNDGNVVARVTNSVFDSNGEYCLLADFIVGGACDDDGDADVDDGFDIDEAGSGSLYASIKNVTVSNNFDEGLDFDEEDDGDIVMRVNNVLASSNEDEGIKASEEGAGNVYALLKQATLAYNNGSNEGIELEEADDGDLVARVISSSLIGGDEALKLEQVDEGDGVVVIRQSNIAELDLEGVVEY